MPEFSGNPPHFGDRGRVDRLRKSLSEGPDDPTGHALLGLYLTIRGLHREAMEEARFALRLDPGTALAHYVLSLSLPGRLDGYRKVVEAIAEAEEAIRLDPLSPSFYAQLAHPYLLQHSTSLQARHASSALRAAEAGVAVGALNRFRYEAVLGVVFGTVGGALVGVVAGLTFVALPWGLLGFVAGMFLGPYVLPKKQRRSVSFRIASFGTCGGILVSAFRHDRARATAGAAAGAITGLLVTAGLVLLLVGAVSLIPRSPMGYDDSDELERVEEEDPSHGGGLRLRRF